MCVVSMIMEHKHDDWMRRYFHENPIVPPVPYTPPPMVPPPPPPPPTAEEIDEFRRLLERAREYDRKHNEPDCEMEEKRQKLRRLADELGVKIDFV